jgi:ABC-type multidrug transport system permease subunit
VHVILVAVIRLAEAGQTSGGIGSSGIALIFLGIGWLLLVIIVVLVVAAYFWRRKRKQGSLNIL